MKPPLIPAIFFLVCASAPAATLRLVQTIPLDGVDGRIDHMSVDLTGQRLFIAAIGNNTVEVINLRAGKCIRSISGFHEPQGVAWIPERGQLFVASGEDETCRVLDGKSFTATPVGAKIEDADNVRYDAGARRVYVGWGNGSIRVLNTANWQTVGEIPLPAHPESFQLESHGPRIFVNVPPTRIEVIDRENARSEGPWTLDNATANFPMALDGSHDHLFVGYRNPPTLAVLSTNHGAALVAVIPIDSDADDAFYDAQRRRIYVSCGAGAIDVIDATELKLLDKIPTASGARTSLFVPELNRLYLAVPHRGNQPAEVCVYEPSDN